MRRRNGHGTPVKMHKSDEYWSMCQAKMTLAHRLKVMTAAIGCDTFSLSEHHTFRRTSSCIARLVQCVTIRSWLIQLPVLVAAHSLLEMLPSYQIAPPAHSSKLSSHCTGPPLTTLLTARVPCANTNHNQHPHAVRRRTNMDMATSEPQPLRS